MKRSSRDHAALLVHLRQLFEVSPVDEAAVLKTVATLMNEYGLSKSMIAHATGRHGKAVFRIVAAHQPDMMRYRAMCGEHSSVVEALSGITPDVREMLRRRFEETGRSYRQAQLRMIRRRLDLGEAFSLDWLTAPPSPACTPPDRNTAASLRQQQHAGVDEDLTFLQTLAELMAHTECQALTRIGGVLAPSGTADKAFPQMTTPETSVTPHAAEEPVLYIGLTEAQIRRLIARLGGQSDLPSLLLHGELMRVIDQ